MLVLLGACLASVPARPTAQAAGLLPEQEAALLQKLATADRQWLPRAETLASGAVRYHYRRRANEPKLSVAELRALIANPPSFGAERLAIGELLTVLAKAGVRLELSQTRKPGAAAELLQPSPFGGAVQIVQALAAAQDPLAPQPAGPDASAPPYAHSRSAPETADQIETCCGTEALKHRQEVIPLTAPMATAPARAP
jgi:hypothetical protein